MMEYSKDLFTCGVIDGEVKDERFKVVDGVIYFYNLILLNKDSKLKEGLLDESMRSCFPNPLVLSKHIILSWVVSYGKV